MPALYSFLFKIAGVDVSSYGLQVSALPDNWDTPTVSFDEAALPGQDGTVATANEPTIEAKDYSIVARLIGATSSAFETALDTLKLAVAGNSSAVVAMKAGNQTTRERSGVCKNVRVVMDPDVLAATVTILMRCRNPVNYEDSTTTVTGSTATDLACALGTFRVRPVSTITSPSSPLVLTYKNYGGTTVQTLTLTFAGSPTTVVVDHSAMTITVDGTRHDSYLTAGDFIRLDPRDGDYALSHWPTLRVSSGTPSHSYAKAWL